MSKATIKNIVTTKRISNVNLYKCTLLPCGQLKVISLFWLSCNSCINHRSFGNNEQGQFFYYFPQSVTGQLALSIMFGYNRNTTHKDIDTV